MSSSTFIRNAWYVAAQSGEITDKPLGRTICNEKIVLFRSLDGIAAVEDFCPHRGAPLSLGFVQDGRLVCGYHGLEMGCNGKPQAMPLQRVQAFHASKRMLWSKNTVLFGFGQVTKTMQMKVCCHT